MNNLSKMKALLFLYVFLSFCFFALTTFYFKINVGWIVGFGMFIQFVFLCFMYRSSKNNKRKEEESQEMTSGEADLTLFFLTFPIFISVTSYGIGEEHGNLIKFGFGIFVLLILCLITVYFIGLTYEKREIADKSKS